MRIVNTRPTERAAQLTADLHLLGYRVYEFPLLSLRALPLDDVLKQQFQAFLSADVVVVVSPIAVRLGMRYAQQLGYRLDQLQQKYWIAVGKSTAKILKEYGIKSITPQLETSEGMLQLPVLQDLKNQRIAFWRGVGGRTLMMQHLQQQGCDVLNMLLYQRQKPEYTVASLTQLFTFLPAIILISSEESWKNWLSLYTRSNGDVLDNVFGQSARDTIINNKYVVLGERVATVIQSYFASQKLTGEIVTITHLDAAHIHQQLQQLSS